MLKALDIAKFEEVQEPEIRILEYKDIFEYISLSNLRPKTKIMNDICTYRNKI